MPKKMLIDATHSEETRVVVVDGNKVEEFDFESENKRQLAGNIYLAKVTRVEPSLQAAFVDYGGNRHGFLAFSEIHPDYYQIPVADRQALLEEERAYAEAQAAKDEDEPKPKRRSRSRSRSKSKAEDVTTEDAKTSGEIEGMETVDLTDDDEVTVSDDEASSPMERVTETPVETPAVDEDASTDADGSDADDSDDDEDGKSTDATAKDESIESVADEDDSEDIRPVRKPRPKRYKIQEVIKVRQILLVQVVKEERGNKGAALTTYLSLAGRYCVLMPNTARGGGISRKITNAADRKKLKEIANEIQVPTGAGLIVRTAGAKRTRAEIKRDYEYLQRLWEQIRELTLKSIAPAKIYEEGDLIKRSIRDLYNREIDEVFVEGERGYRIAKDFMKMIMPSHAKNVKRYEEGLPLFARYQVESYLSGMFNPTVQLPSGGYIVIGVTEALVAIDVNSGRATKEGSIEQTALKTNLEAADEVARQLRLRDLAGLIVIDFIDMDERKNNASVEKRMKDKLKTDRARIQVGRISGFGLMEMSRQRLRPGMIEATTQPCQACHGTGLIRSDDNLALSIIRQIEEEGTRRRSREVLVKCPVGIANFLMNQKREHIAQIEARYGLSVRIEGDPSLVSPEFTLEKFKTATRNVAPVADHIVSVDTSLMDQIDEDEADTSSDEEAPEAQSSSHDNGNADGEGKPKRRRRRRRSRGGRGKNGGGDYQNGEDNKDASSADENGDAPQNAEGAEAAEPANQDTAEEAKPDAAPVAADTATEAEAEAPVTEEKPKPKTRSRSRSTSAKAKAEKEAAETAADGDAKTAEPAPEAAEEEKPKPKRTRAKAKPKPKAETKVSEEVKEDAPAEAKADDAAEEKPKPKRTRAKAKPKAEPKTKAAPKTKAKAEEPAPTPAPEETKAPEQAPAPTPEPVAAEETKAVEPVAAAEPVAEAKPEPAEEPKKPKRRGWWSLGR
ncbi:Rne/Rng family ribonuclease [Sulfitobacter mediterraneus]|uniref:Rne/Rng family ribonuclease n=1 Tax=Sulfitobacter mediterraneus TaxID=83219 RepID=UPI0021A38A33|nr:Rne/Rng family ribonuclease [Sulfitobacter mediterraneus]UWR13018.1 Rne/Rng family ribonuclease [Sulfitobacter mediterraneus]